MKERRVTFKSSDLTLEGMIASPDGAGPHRAAVVCHPHPLYGGSMYNNVVDAVLEAMHARGFATLRFNFRGVGQSEGEFDNGNGEADDTVAAIRFLIAQKGVRADGAVLAGYSFGAMTAVRAAAGVEQVAAIDGEGGERGVERAEVVLGGFIGTDVLGGDDCGEVAA